MVDCGNPRCAQERRFFKKELLSWSKKIPLMIALEQIAGDYAGKDHVKEFSNPYTDLESNELDDWQPDDSCFYCQGQLTNILDLVDSLLQDARQGKLDPDNAYARSLQDVLPFCMHYYTQGLGRDLLAELSSKSSFCNNSSATSAAAVAQPPNPAEVDDPDVSAAALHKAHVELKIPHILQSGRGRKNESTQSGGMKRAYTEEELEAAIADIRGGRLGTRRASVLYGIPRSTLRNKIFRNTDMDRGSAFFDLDDSNSGDEAVTTALRTSMKLSDLVQSGAFSYLAALPPHPGTAKEEGECQAGASDDFSLKLEQIRRMHNLKGDRDIQIKPAHINQLKLPVLSTLIRKLVEQRFEMELGIGRGFGHQDPNVGGSRSSTPALSEDRKSQAISVDTLPHFIPYLPSFSPSCLALSVPSSVEDLRIPSYKPASAQQQQQQQQHPHQQDTCSVDEEPIIRPFGKVNETSRIGDTLKDIIAKTISEKVKFRDADSSPMYPLVTDLFGRVHPVSDAFSLELGKSAFHACRADISQPTYPAKRIKREAAEEEESGVAKSSSHMKIHSSTVNKGTSQQSYTGHAGRGKRGERSHGSSSHSGTSSSKGGNDGANKEKKTRPKRGQYRKYNSQLLIEAVRAVQRGEMSVHRAGSYFGVPHSTLEYKVKERHLLRQKKPRETGSSSTATTTTTVSTASVSMATVTASSSSSPVHAASSPTASTSKHSILSSGSDSSGSCSRFSSQHQGGGGSVASKADTPHLPSSSSPSASLSALGFGLNKSAASEFPWFQPYLVADPTPSPFDPALSLFPQGFALNTSASELLRKLQHKVQSKSTASSPFSPESSFGFPHPNGSSSLREGFLLFN